MLHSHFDSVSFYVPDLKSRNILDLGSGYGGFLIEAAQEGASAVGVEIFDNFIKASHEEAQKRNVSIKIIKAGGEKLPFPDKTFDFVNMSELIEHVQDPKQVLGEVFRVLRPGGKVYLSAPNRFAFWDPHFHLYFVNFLPRSLSNWYIGLFKKHKEYGQEMGHQRLDEMHYYTYGGIMKFTRSCGFEAEDMRPIKINRKYHGLKKICAHIAYRIMRPWYFDSYHILLTKKV